FDRRDLRALAQDRIGDARSRRLAVDQQRARTARALLAAKMRAGQTEPFAQQVGKVHARLYRLDDRHGVHGEAYGFHWAIACAAARARAVMWRRAGAVSPARSSSSLATLSSRRTAAPGCGVPPNIVRASSTTTRPPPPARPAAPRPTSPASHTRPPAGATPPAWRQTLESPRRAGGEGRGMRVACSRSPGSTTPSTAPITNWSIGPRRDWRPSVTM